MVLDLLLALVIRHITPVRPHTEPEIRPLVAAVAHAAVAVEVCKLTTEGLAVEGGVEGFPAGHGGGVEFGGVDRGVVYLGGGFGGRFWMGGGGGGG